MNTPRWSTLIWIATVVCAAESVAVLLEADRAFDRETNARGIDGWVAWFADEGRMFPEGSDVIQGKAAIRDLMGPFLSRSGSSLRWAPLFGDIAASGDLGYTVGHSTSRRPNEAGEMVDHFGKYVTIWKKQTDGGWKVALDIGNGRPGP